MLETSGLWHFKAYDVLIPNPEGPVTYVLHCIYTWYDPYVRIDRFYLEMQFW